uniref:Uncharacterized protein n=1 Tax=Anguilla anguilla TaxID=7936 RepID=A0A0E9U7N8_ANGAN
MKINTYRCIIRHDVTACRFENRSMTQTTCLKSSQWSLLLAHGH